MASPTEPPVEHDRRFDDRIDRDSRNDTTTAMQIRFVELTGRLDRQAEMFIGFNDLLRSIDERLRKMEVDSIGIITTLQQQVAASWKAIEQTRVDLNRAIEERQKTTDSLSRRDDELNRCIDDLGVQVSTVLNKETIKKIEAIPEKLDTRLQKLEDVIPGLVFANKLLVFVASAVGVAVIALIWGIITHSVTIGAIP